MAVKPIAGTARIVPGTSPLTRSCASSLTRLSDHLEPLELALLSLIEADLAVHDVARLREVARPGGALVVDRLALGEELEPVHRAVHLGAAALRDLANVLADGRPRGIAAGVGDRQEHQADVVVALAGIG